MSFLPKSYQLQFTIILQHLILLFFHLESLNDHVYEHYVRPVGALYSPCVSQ